MFFALAGIFEGWFNLVVRRARTLWAGAFASVVDFVRRPGAGAQTSHREPGRLASLSALWVGMNDSLTAAIVETCTSRTPQVSDSTYYSLSAPARAGSALKKAHRFQVFTWRGRSPPFEKPLQLQNLSGLGSCWAVGIRQV